MHAALWSGEACFHPVTENLLRVEKKKSHILLTPHEYFIILMQMVHVVVDMTSDSEFPFIMLLNIKKWGFGGKQTAFSQIP